MSWLWLAVNKAVEVGGQNSVSRAVRSYADTVVNTAVGGSKLFLDAAVLFSNLSTSMFIANLTCGFLINRLKFVNPVPFQLINNIEENQA